MYEYTTQVFSVGLGGFAPMDDDKISAMGAEGWEPLHMTPVHNGFAALVLFRREITGAARRPAPAKATPAKAAKAAAKGKAAAKAAPAPAPASRRAAGTTGARVRRTRSS